MHSVEAGLLRGKVPYLRGGSGPREATVFFGVNALFKPIHQTANPGRYVRQVARILPQHRITILGYSGSRYDEIVEDLAGVIPTPPDLVMGISFGGFVAMRFAAQYPSLMRRLVLLVSAHRFSSNGERMVERQFDALEKGDLRTLVRENALLFRRPWYNWLLRLKLWKDGDRLASEFRDPRSILHDYRQLMGQEVMRHAEYARRISCPTLIIGGSRDQLFDRPVLEQTAAWIPGAQVRILEGETHMLPIERSREVAAVIRDFAEGVHS